MKDDRVHLNHILDCIGAIQDYNASRPDAFLNDRKTHKATLRELQELAESTQRLSDPLKSKYPDVPWSAIAGFRNVLVHDYLGLSLNRIWEVIERDLPSLRVVVEIMLKELEQNNRE